MQVIDSHTEGEPTRVVVAGGPELGSGPINERLLRFRDTADHYRQFLINEPRGWDAMVGALLCEPCDPNCAAGVIFFNNTGYLGMCGHGAIGVAVTLHYLGRIGLGLHQLETPVGQVSVDLQSGNQVTIENVPSYRYRQNVSVDVEGLGTVCGDIAWGGNWFFLVHDAPLPLVVDNIDELVLVSRRIQTALAVQGHTGRDGSVIDHVEFSEDRVMNGADSRNFVLCPGGVYDRSPCGTGTSAKLACLAADGKLAPATKWVQESVIGGRFVGEYRRELATLDGHALVVPSITGKAFICGETKLIGQAGDPFACGFNSGGTAEHV